MENNKIVTYSLLAHINNSGIGITDFSDIFVPLIKRVISKMNDEGHNKGKDVGEIKHKVDQTYFLDVPYPFLKKIVRRIANEVNKGDEIKFQVYNDSSFIIKDFVFAEYEDTILRQEKDVRDIEELYHQFLQISNVNIETQPSIFEYIDKNRASLSRYFVSSAENQTEIDFSLQAKFINSFKDNATIYAILRKIYIGSIISSYLEFETEGKGLKEGIEFVLDTNFLIGLLDLTTVESTHTCSKILDACKNLGYRMSVLDYTIEETKELLHRTAENYGEVFLVKRIHPNSIYNACDRRNLSQTDLQRMAANLESTILHDFGVFIVSDTQKLRNEAKYSAEYDMFKKIRINEWSALHDATTVKYVQHRRGKRVKDFYEAKCWFVTNPHHELRFLSKDGFVPEIISAEDLVNILWLTNPNLKANMNVNDLSEIGLSRLVSSTLSASLPSVRILKELDQNIQKYAKDNISDKEIIRVAKRIANKTNANLEELNQIASKDSGEFVRRLQEEAKKEETETARFEEKLKSLILKIKQQVEERAKERESRLAAGYLQKEEDLRLDLKLALAQELARKDEELKKILLLNLKMAFAPLEMTKQAYVKKANTRAQLYSTIAILLPLFAATFLYFNFGWNFFDSKSILPTILLYLLQYFYFVWKNKEWSLTHMLADLKDRQCLRLCKKFDFDVAQYDQLKIEIERIEKELQ